MFIYYRRVRISQAPQFDLSAGDGVLFLSGGNLLEFPKGDKMRFGAHISIAGGVSRALERAKDLDISVFQIFSRNPRSRGKSL